MLSEIKGIVLRSGIYSIGNILLKAVTILLLPLYTRILTPSDYGILAVTSVISFILGVIISLSLHGFVSPLYFSGKNPKERMEGIGTLFVANILIGGAITSIIDQIGGFLFPLIVRDVPFYPYIRIAIWTTYFTLWQLIPLNLLQTQERSILYITLTIFGSLLQIGLIICFTVYLNQGVTGVLIGQMIAALVMIIPYTGIALRNMILSLKIDVLRQALVFSLPLIPHSLAGWILEFSDRMILQWYVPLDQLGLFSLAYSYASLHSLFSYAINMAWVPYLFRTDASEGEKAALRLGQMGTYFALVLCFIALCLNYATKPLIILLTTSSYYGAIDIAPWIIFGLLLSGLYYFPVGFLFLRRKTKIVPQVTAIPAFINVILNLWLIPAYGVIAAAWTTCLSYGVMLILVWLSSLRVYPVAYEYKRLAIIFLSTLVLWVFICWSTRWSNFWLEFTGGLIALFLFPFAINILGFFSDIEKQKIRTITITLLSRLNTKLH